MGQKRYWKSEADLNNDPAFVAQQFSEFGKDVPIEQMLVEGTGLSSNRRDFLKFFGFGITAATLAACTKPPVKYALPYAKAPTDLNPSISNYYASTAYDGQEAMHVVVKTRDGRPIKIEGNSLSPISRGASSRINASILGLYDTARLRGPVKKDGATTWEKADAEVAAQLTAVAASGAEIVLVTNSVISPSTQAVIKAFCVKWNARHVSYDAVSASGILEANETNFGVARIPGYRFDKAEAIVGINADFLGTWLQPTHYTKQYADGRRVSKEKRSMSRHLQFETVLTLTGSNADYRYPVRPSQEGALLLNLYNKIAAKAGAAQYNAPALELAGNAIQMAADTLWNARGKALVVAGSNSTDAQLVVNAINLLLDSYGTTIDWSAHTDLRQGRDSDIANLTTQMSAGRVGAVIVYDANPAYSYPGFGEALAKAKLSVSFATRADETSALCNYTLPDSHYLESWNDAQIEHGVYSIVQPTIQTLFDTRQAQQTLLNWSGDTTPYYDYVRAQWKEAFGFNKKKAEGSFETFWQKALVDGSAIAERSVGARLDRKEVDLGAAANALQKAQAGEGTEVLFYQKIGIGDGTLAQLPWLQELPDPMTKATWDNYVTVSTHNAKAQGLKTGSIVSVKANGATVELPVIVLPGQARDTVGIALGYGRTLGHTEASTMVVGKNVYPMVGTASGLRSYATTATITATGATEELAITQTHQTIMGRGDDILRETTLAEYKADPYAGNEHKHEMLRTKEGDFINLWGRHEKNGHYWSMAIDLNACTGCGACVISCQAENNVAVVGKDEVRRGREMHWIRIDRYFSSSADNIEAGAEQPEVVFQPMLCQHCDNAPCESVCPVLATTHSSEGLNQMTYNRCIGTRYCANNCPYKVRRFNWWDYANQDQLFPNGAKFPYNPVDELGRMVLNPDVTVRARGVMEKCTFCVQRLQAAKLEAKKEGRMIKDAEVQPACANSCPSGAIVFGDLNDPDSAISKYYNTERSFHVIEQVKTLPHVSYMTKVRNKDKADHLFDKEPSAIPWEQKRKEAAATPAPAHS
jgi:MoCo/4Fe-4S cofactor protein with predicted Tat translocation signal